MAKDGLGFPTTKGNGFVSEPVQQEDPATALKRKQKKSIEGEFNQPDVIGDFVRRVIGANKEKKKSGF